MNTKSYSEILTELCDNFDNLIYPEKIERNDANIIYLMLKAQAKGEEVINNTLVSSSTPFNPLSCTKKQLDSLEMITQVQRLAGKSSGLLITISNTNIASKTILAGEYQYKFSETAVFKRTIAENITLGNNASVQLIFMSESVGSFEVDAISSINVESTAEIPDGIIFSCANNSGILGREAETDNEYRERLLQINNKQSVVASMKEEIDKLPYVIDCSIAFNPTLSNITIAGNTLKPFHWFICVSGEVKQEIANIIASRTLNPTQAIAGKSTQFTYTDDSLITPINIYINSFSEFKYKVSITYSLTNSNINTTELQNTITAVLKSKLNTMKHYDKVVESDIYNAVIAEGYSNLSVLNVDLYDISSGTATAVQYLTIPKISIPILDSVVYTKV